MTSKSEWYMFWNDERAMCQLEFFRGRVYVHLLIRQPMAGMRAAKRHWGALRHMVRSIGYSWLHVIIPEGDDKLYRFERLFGFSEIKRAGGFILMAQEC